MKLLLLSCCTLGLVAGLNALDAYPSSYPFENESDPPAAPLAATPSHAYKDDGSDPGGYGYHYVYKRIFTEEDLPFSTWSSGAMKWYSVFHRGFPEEIDDHYFNCTLSGKGATFNSGTFPGKVNTYVWCEEGECCKKHYGLTVKKTNEPYIEMHANMAEVFEGGLCTDAGMFHEELYCILVDDQFTSWCHEQVVSVMERGIVTPCYDSYYNWIFRGCKLFAVTGRFFAEYEPAVYVSLSTVAENQAAHGVKGSFSDKICLPYSYYYPETAKDFAGAGSSITSSDDTSSAPVFFLASIPLFIASYAL